MHTNDICYGSQATCICYKYESCVNALEELGQNGNMDIISISF